MIKFIMVEESTELENWLKRSPCRRCNSLDESTWCEFDGNSIPRCEIYVVDIVFRQSYLGVKKEGSTRKVYRDCLFKNYAN